MNEHELPQSPASHIKGLQGSGNMSFLNLPNTLDAWGRNGLGRESGAHEGESNEEEELEGLCPQALMPLQVSHHA